MCFEGKLKSYQQKITVFPEHTTNAHGCRCAHVHECTHIYTKVNKLILQYLKIRLCKYHIAGKFGKLTLFKHLAKESLVN